VMGYLKPPFSIGRNIANTIFFLEVLAGFMSTAFITFLAVLYGYISKSLPADYYNEFDLWIIPFIQKPLQWIIAFIQKLLYWIIAFPRGPLQSQELDADLDSKRKRMEMKTKTLERFILALSDQQLVTGLAVLIAGLVKCCTLSYWEFLIVVSLAWFSSTTHLSTLVVLRNYFHNHKTVRNWRVAGMLFMLVLLFFSILVQVALPPNYEISAPMECVFMNMASGLALDPGYMVPVILVFLFFAYANQLVKLFSVDRQKTVFSILRKSIINVCIMVFGRVSSRKWRVKYSAIVKERLANRPGIQRRKMLQRFIDRTPKQQKWIILEARLISIFALLSEASAAYLDSFMWQIVWLIFGLAFGISQIVQNRWISLPPLDGSDSRMDFGQIVPLLLLTLPMLAAGEAYYGEHFFLQVLPIIYPQMSGWKSDLTILLALIRLGLRMER
jgi:hypothetical protein